MRRPLIDLSFNLSVPAFAVMHAVNRAEITYEVDNVQTVPWYNGRERGILLCVQRKYGSQALCVAVYEHRVSDHIVVANWKQLVGMNPPTCYEAVDQNRFSSAVDKAEEFKCGEINAAANHVLAVVEAFVQEKALTKKELVRPEGIEQAVWDRASEADRKFFVNASNVLRSRGPG